jgi:hypothetical protein
LLVRNQALLVCRTAGDFVPESADLGLKAGLDGARQTRVRPQGVFQKFDGLLVKPLSAVDIDLSADQRMDDSTLHAFGLPPLESTAGRIDPVRPVGDDFTRNAGDVNLFEAVASNPVRVNDALLEEP